MFNIYLNDNWKKKKSTTQTRFIPASWLKDPSSAVQISVELLFGKHWSHISLLQTDLWEQPRLDWAAET